MAFGKSARIQPDSHLCLSAYSRFMCAPVPVSLLLLAAGGLSACTVLEYPRKWPDAPLIPRQGPGVPLEDTAPELPAIRRPSPAPSRPSRQTETSPEEVEAVLEMARNLVGARGPLVVDERRFPYDCSGFVCALYYQVGMELLVTAEEDTASGMSGTEIIYRKLQRENRLFSKDPSPGDLVFFDDTWDKNGDGQLNDPFTHIGVVEQVGTDQTLVLLHLGNSGIGRLRMNLTRPHEQKDTQTGTILNDLLRRRTRQDGDGTPYLTAELFRAFGRPMD